MKYGAECRACLKIWGAPTLDIAEEMLMFHHSACPHPAPVWPSPSGLILFVDPDLYDRFAAQV